MTVLRRIAGTLAVNTLLMKVGDSPRDDWDSVDFARE